MTRGVFLVAALLALAGCVQPQPRYVVGEPYRLGGVWSYPKEDFALVETGLAEVLPAPVLGGQTANGEVLNAQSLTAAHRSLQLPAVIRVTNLENGRSILLRVNDRGPEKRGRILGVSQRAATLLGMALGGWMSGKVFDLTGSYHAAFINGVLWNALNLSVALWLLWRVKRAAVHSA